MVAPEISGVPLRSSEIKQLNKNHRTVVFTVSVILSFELLIHLIYKAFHSLASSANLRRICIFACQFTLFVIWQARQMWIQLAKSCLQIAPVFTHSLTLQAGQVDTQIWKIKFLYHSFCRLLGITPSPEIEIIFYKIISSSASPKLMFLQKLKSLFYQKNNCSTY